ncbi:metal ABC transporter ATP-binding protein [Oscillospiraceae bacterium LCP25S3_E10]
MLAILTCDNVSMSYDGNVVFRDLNFKIDAGDYLCIVGENGSGKSTLMKGILGLHTPSYGRFIFDEGLKQKEIGYLPQQTGAQKDFPASVWEVVLSGRLNKKRLAGFYNKEDKKIAQETLEKLGISQLKKRCYKELSGGQQQRVLLARALCATGKLILLDEPVAGLDPVAMAHMYSIIKELNDKDKITVIMVSHDIISAVQYATHILHMCVNGDMFFGTKDQYEHSELGSRFLYHNCHCDACEKHKQKHLHLYDEVNKNSGWGGSK